MVIMLISFKLDSIHASLCKCEGMFDVL